MIGRSDIHASVIRVLATYAVACFVVLQLLDVVQEPLGVSVATFRTIMLLMIGITPLIVIIVTFRSRGQVVATDDVAAQPGQDIVFRMGNAELDTAQRQIRFNGKAADVQPKVFDLIEYLVRSRERVVSKNELFDNIWPDVVVTEASLTQSIKRARDLFRQNGFENDVIRTVPRKGYQFDGPTEIAATKGQRQPGAWFDVVLPTALVSVVAAVLGTLVWNSNSGSEYQPVASNAANSLVVLPFANMTADQGFRYFSDGLTETLMNSLTTVRDLRIIARGSAFSFGDGQPDYAVIGQELNVAHIVEGSVQRNNNELRISARLIRAQDGEQLWSQIYSGDFENAFELQDNISHSIVEQMSTLLATRLVLPNDDNVDRDSANSAEAFRLLLLGRDQQRSRSASDLRDAEDSYRAALQIRPDYPEAMLSLASAIRVRAVLGELPREPTFAEALTLLRRSLELRPDYAEAFVQLGEIQHRHFWDFDDAKLSYAKALELNPGSASAHSAFSRFLSKSGDFDAAVREAEIALDLDPRSAQSASSLAIRQIRARRLETARVVIDRLAEIYPDYADLPWLETNWHIRNGSYRDALKWIALEELDYLRLSLAAITLHQLGRKNQAQEALDELIATDGDGAAFQIAEVYAQWGMLDEAFEWLEHAFSQGDPGMAELHSSVNLENLHADARYAELVVRVGLPALETT